MRAECWMCNGAWVPEDWDGSPVCPTCNGTGLVGPDIPEIPRNQPLAAKDKSRHRYTKDFTMTACIVQRRPGDYIGEFNGHELYVIRQCFIEEFGHLDGMRLSYTNAVQYWAGDTVLFYELGCSCSHPQLITTGPQKTAIN